ncbi:MAG: hypothetical protein ABI746_09890 [Dermatophilaceae bacterium]
MRAWDDSPENKRLSEDWWAVKKVPDHRPADPQQMGQARHRQPHPR